MENYIVFRFYQFAWKPGPKAVYVYEEQRLHTAVKCDKLTKKHGGTSYVNKMVQKR